jgi:hypothetical protein
VLLVGWFMHSCDQKRGIPATMLNYSTASKEESHSNIYIYIYIYIEDLPIIWKIQQQPFIYPAIVFLFPDPSYSLRAFGLFYVQVSIKVFWQARQGYRPARHATFLYLFLLVLRPSYYDSIFLPIVHDDFT